MSPRRKLKKELAKAKAYRRDLPLLIDFSDVYGDETFTPDDVEKADARIAELEKQLGELTVSLNK